jgi:hypothetical protein
MVPRRGGRPLALTIPVKTPDSSGFAGVAKFPASGNFSGNLKKMGLGHGFSGSGEKNMEPKITNVQRTSVLQGIKQGSF